ncbi:MAG: DNA-directed RNA polymerase subunit beta, partial [Planctomycetes bacterium]|nr:DNA-directed RNA polymerase subunit beta [Planctomycetota bacterium]
MQIRDYAKHKTVVEVPNLVELQLKAYNHFLQLDRPSIDRRNQGLEAILKELFPVKSYDEKMTLDYLGHELGRPRYSPDECRRLKLTYGAPFKVRFRLVKEESVEEEVYLGEIPLMIGGGEFIINGSERVIVSQLHRSPGIDFDEEVHAGAKKLQVCWIIP